MVELLIAVVILGVLAALSLPAYAWVRDRARSAVARYYVANEGRACLAALVNGDSHLYTPHAESDFTFSPDPDLDECRAVDVPITLCATGGGDTWVLTVEPGVPARTQLGSEGDCSASSPADPSDGAPGKSEEAPGKSEEAPGKSEEAPGKSEEAPGKSKKA